MFGPEPHRPTWHSQTPTLVFLLVACTEGLQRLLAVPTWPSLPRVLLAPIDNSGFCNATNLEALRGQRFLFGTHHKTGTVLAEQVRDCIHEHHPDLTVDVVEHFVGPEEIGNYSKVVHFIRSPVSIVVSAYLYHKEVGEDRDDEAGSARSKIATDYMGRDEVLVLPNESYKHFLQRMPAHIGLHTELRRFLKPNPTDRALDRGHEGLQMKTAHERCQRHGEKCREICLERFVEDSDTFLATWRAALQYIGICLDALDELPLKHCVEAADVNSATFVGKSKHITANMVPSRINEEWKRVVRQLDDELHSGKATALEDAMKCA